MTNVVIQKGISSGAPTILGRRLTVYNVIAKIYYEEDLANALEDYDISIEVVKDAIDYCKNLCCQQDVNLIKFCDGCVLRTLQDGWNFERGNYQEVQIKEGEIITVSKNGSNIFLGTIQELENQDFGKVGWLLAAEAEKKILGMNE